MSWFFDPINFYDPCDDRLFFTSKESFIINTSIDIDKITGSNDIRLKNKTWLDIRLDKNNVSLLTKKPDYYTNCDYKFIEYLTLDGNNYYIKNDGHQRTLLAKIYLKSLGLTHIKGVTVTRYDINHKLYNSFKRTQEIILKKNKPIILEPVKKVISIDDDQSQRITTYQTFIKYIDLKEKVELIFNEKTWYLERCFL